ncbi:MAG: POT family MFS transporter [Verrucomicrobiota bacterium]|nr:POT family MFS transporter [Verrucomicrobiota bacterium]
MAKSKYLTAPLKTDRMPPGVPYIVGNEAAERFSYYGMNSILVIFMTQYLMNARGRPDHMTDAQADAWYHAFVSAVYFLPVLGAFLSDALLGKYLVILLLSVVYCFGHFTLAMNDTPLGLALGLGLIALGAGGIKPCVSANVGDQFGATNQRLLPRMFNWFYFSINLGSAFSTLLIPELLDRVGPRIAFGVPGIAMLIATVVFWMGRRKFVHIPPAGFRAFLGQFFSLKKSVETKSATAATGCSKSAAWFKGFLAGFNRENLKALLNLLILVPFAAMFWALWQQNFSSWVLQAEHMNRRLFGHDWLPNQIQTVNPIFILLMLPLFSYVIYPALERFVRVTPLRRFGAGLWAVIAAFLIVGWIQARIDAGQHPTILWQILAFVVLTAGEVMLSVTHLEFSYTQAPRKLKSLVMCMYLGSISLGNVFTAAVNFFIQNSDGSVKLSGASYYFFFVKVMLVTAVLFVFVSRFYRGRTYIQDEVEPQPA